MSRAASGDVATTVRQASIAGLIPMVDRVTAAVRARCAPLTPQQLAWRPAEERWSAVLCLDHLMTTFATYDSRFDTLFAGTYRPGLLARVPGVPALFGRMLIGSLAPGNNAEAPGVFRPDEATTTDALLARFEASQDRLIDTMRRADAMRLHDAVITSPASDWVVYSVLDAFRILTIHELAHLAQLEAVLDDPAFPR